MSGSKKKSGEPEIVENGRFVVRTLELKRRKKTVASKLKRSSNDWRNNRGYCLVIKAEELVDDLELMAWVIQSSLETGDSNEAMVRVVHPPSLKRRDANTDMFLMLADWSPTGAGSKQGDRKVNKDKMKGRIGSKKPAINIGTSGAVPSGGGN